MSIAIANKVRASASTFGAKAAHNDAMQSFTKEYLAKKDEVAQGPLFLSLQLEELFGDDMSGTPTPGTEEGDVSGNQLPDIYKTTETVDGKVRDVEGSWIKDFVAVQPAALAILAQKEGIKLAQKGDPTTPAEWSHLSGNKPECEGWLNYYQGKYTSLVNLYRRAFALWHKMAAINAKPGLAAAIITDAENNVTDSTNVMRLSDESDHKDARAHVKDMSIASFERLDLSRLDNSEWMAKAGGNNYMALMATTNRGAGAGKARKIKVDNIIEVDDAFAALSGWIKANGTSAYGKLITELSKKPEDSDDLVYSVGIVADFLDGVMPKIQGRFDRLAAKQADKLNAPETDNGKAVAPTKAA